MGDLKKSCCPCLNPPWVLCSELQDWHKLQELRNRRQFLQPVQDLNSPPIYLALVNMRYLKWDCKQQEGYAKVVLGNSGVLGFEVVTYLPDEGDMLFPLWMVLIWRGREHSELYNLCARDACWGVTCLVTSCLMLWIIYLSHCQFFIRHSCKSVWSS